MLIKELCRSIGLGKKAVEYYVEQGLVQPSTLENGYRDFSEEDAILLEKVAILRKLGLGLEEIRPILAEDKKGMERAVAARKEAAMLAGRQAELLRRLAKSGDWREVGEEIRALERERSIAVRLKSAFPGYYGNFLALHFAAFLQEPVQGPEQQGAFEELIAFLDEMEVPVLPPELQAYLEEISGQVGEELMIGQTEAMRRAAADWPAYMEENRESMETYMAFRQSEEYKNSSAAALKAWMDAFQKSSGYNDRFIPAMRRLSPSYDQYQRQLEKANEAFLAEYPTLQDAKE